MSLAREKEMNILRRIGNESRESVRELVNHLLELQYGALETSSSTENIFRAQGAIAVYKDILKLIEGLKK